MHFPHFKSLIAALILFGMVTAAPIPQGETVSISADPILLAVGFDVDLGPDKL